MVTKVKRCTQQSTKPFILFTENVNVTILYPSALLAPSRLDSGPRSVATKQCMRVSHKGFTSCHGLDGNQADEFVSWIVPYNFTIGGILKSKDSFYVYNYSYLHP